MPRFFLPLAVLILMAAAALRISQLYRYPPGPHYDEAVNVLMIRSIAYGGANLFPIADSYQGRETLYHYYNALLYKTIGDHVFTMHVSSVFAGMVTLAATMALARTMFAGPRGLVIGLAAGVLMAISFHQIFMARQAYRAVTLPLMQSLGLLFLWRGLNVRRHDWLWLMLGGLFSGGALYTYMASRLFPVWLALGGLALLLLDRINWRVRLRQGAVFFAALMLTAVPMIHYALENPDIFLNRLDEVTDSGTSVSLMTSVRRHAEMFFIRGEDGNLRYNPPGRPYFTPPEGALLLVGLGAALMRLLRRGKPAERAAYALALLSPLMVLPSVVALGGLPPNHMRSLGMVPLIFVLAAAGFDAVVTWAAGRWRGGRFAATGRVFLPAAALIVLLVVGGALVWRDYLVWVRRADLFYQADGDLAAAARWLPGQVDANTLVYVASFHREHPTLITAWDGPVTWLGFDSLFLPPPGKSGLYIVAHDAVLPSEWVAWLSQGAITDVPPGPDGGPAFYAFRLSSDTAIPIADEPSLGIRNALMTLMTVQTGPAPSGEQAAVTLRWHINQTPPFYRLRPVLRLEDPGGAVLSENDLFLLGTNNWHPGEIMFQQILVDVPAGTPPGEYDLTMLWVDRDSGEYLSYIGVNGAHAGIAAQIGTLEVIRPQTLPDPTALEIAVRQPHEFSSGVRLLGWNPAANAARPGETLAPVLFWQAAPGLREQVFRLRVLLRGEHGDTLLWQGQPLEGRYPPPQWRDGELLAEYARWPVPRDQPAGRYTLILQAAETEVVLGAVEISGIARVFEPPPVEIRLDYRLGDSLVLVGYTLRLEDGIQLDLVWSVSGPVTENYTVFVHLVDASGVIVDQRDAMPVGNTYATGLWVAGEFVSDHYHFANVPPGEYRLRVGLYIQANGARLDVFASDGQRLGDFIEIGTIFLSACPTNEEHISV